MTLSEEQFKVARRRAAEAGVAERVRFELIDYRSLTGTFDRIVSVGMFEHVGAAHYDEFFATCRDLLAPDGVMLLHTIGRLGRRRSIPIRSSANISFRAIISVAVADERGEPEGAADRVRRRDAAAALCFYAARMDQADAAEGGRSSRCTTSASTGCGSSISRDR